MTGSAPLAWLNGHFVPASGVGVGGVGGGGVSPLDAGFLLGHGVFETLRAEAGDLPLWRMHLARLESGARQLGIPPEPPGDLRARARELLARCDAVDGVLRITLTGGEVGAGRPTWCMTTRPRPGTTGPVRLHVVALERSAADPTVAIKCTSRAPLSWARARAQEAGADDALLVDTLGRVLETTTANVFVVDDRGEIRTPRLDGAVLPGIARAELIAGLGERGVRVREVDCVEAVASVATTLMVTNAVHGPRAAVLVGAEHRTQPPVVTLSEAVWQQRLARAAELG